jgi:hypothetical protein
MSPENLRERIIEDNESASSYGLNSQISNEGKKKGFSIKNKKKSKVPKKDRKTRRQDNDEISSSSSEDEAVKDSVPDSYFKSNLEINQNSHEIFVIEETGHFGGDNQQNEEYDPYDVDSSDSHIKYQ